MCLQKIREKPPKPCHCFPIAPAKSNLAMADNKERTPLLRGDGGPNNHRRRKHIRSRSAGPTRQRSLGEVFTLDDDNRTLHKISQHGSEHGELQRNYSRFLLYGGDGGHSRKSSSGGVSNSSMGGGGGGSGGTGSKRSHRRQWSSATEPHRNISSPTSSNRRPKDDKERQDTIKQQDNKKGDNNRTIIQFERDYYAMMVRRMVLFP